MYPNHQHQGGQSSSNWDNGIHNDSTSVRARRSRSPVPPDGMSPLSRRVATATATMPSMRSVVPTGPPREPAVMPGVGVGIYESASGSANQAMQPSAAAVASASAAAPRLNFQTSSIGIPAAASAPAAHQNFQTSGGDPYAHQQQRQQHQHHPPAAAPVAVHQGGQPNLRQEASDGSNNCLPNAPYQDMMQQRQQYEQDPDPTVERARNIMATHQQERREHQERPYPRAGLPQEPTTQNAMEPTVPHSRLGRRCLTHKPKREADLCKGRMVSAENIVNIRRASQNNNKMSANLYFVECAECGVTLQIVKSAIVVKCPNCDQVNQTASCPAVLFVEY